MVFSPIYRPLMKPVWSSEISSVKVVLILSAIHADAILYMIFSKVKGRQFFKNCFGLSPFGRHVIRPSLLKIDNFPSIYPSFNALYMKTLISIKKN